MIAKRAAVASALSSAGFGGRVKALALRIQQAKAFQKS
jgi:galactokinase